MKLYKLLMMGVFMFGNPFDDGIDGQVKEVPDTTVEQAQQEAKKRKFLQTMSQIESSGGQNTNHSTLKKGIHQGEHAIGQYGLMPNTLDELTNRMKRDGNLDPRIKALYEEDLTPQERADRISNDPELENIYANRLYQHVNQNYGGNEEQMAQSWQFGHNTPATKLTPDVLNKSERIKKFRQLSGVLNKK